MHIQNSYGPIHMTVVKQPKHDQAQVQTPPVNNFNNHEAHRFNNMYIPTQNELNVSGLEQNNTANVHTDPQHGAVGHQNGSVNLTTSNDVLNKDDISGQPRYPVYADKSIRLSTFKNSSQTIAQMQDEMAEAGFFYSEKDDGILCFYCGIGLKAWDWEDNVWIEHARFAPQCKHLINCKGTDFVKIVSYAAKCHERNVAVGQQTGTRAPGNGGSVSVNHEANEKMAVKNSTTYLLTTVAAQSLLENSYEEDVVAKAINVYKHNEGSVDFDAKDLLRIIFNLEDGIINYDEVMSNITDSYEQSETALKLPVTGQTRKNNGTTEYESDALKVKSLVEENRRLQEQTLCKVCLEETVCIVFLPCGHLCCCLQCAPDIRKCPNCRDIIKGTIKASLS